MKKLSAAQKKTKADLTVQLAEQGEKLADAITQYNDAVQEAWDAVEEARDTYNGILAEARDLMGEVACQIEDYVSARSEKWHESDKASAYEDWKTSWEQGMEDYEFEQPESLDEVDMSEHSVMLDDLPEELEG